VRCFNYKPDTRTCVIFSNYDSSSLVDATDTDVYHKQCITSPNVCSSPFAFEVYPQRILVGYAMDSIYVSSAQECLAECLNMGKFECQSAMFYPADKECILNAENMYDRPDSFTNETLDAVLYFDNNCAASQCQQSEITQYTRIEGQAPRNELDFAVENISLEECANICDNRLSFESTQFNCKSFVYRENTRTCILSDEKAKPLGRAELTKDEGDYYEKTCFKSAKVCRNVPSFVRVPQKILVATPLSYWKL
jgi:hypothetical protein